ncbi:uncharacterized protein JN550_003698 [Neoarthrinium moseri]|uniref:uncharacterized protein n=1 Tax=Neoarthrinium moseri TaxID=1658444 RepID=UPI001FDD945D|nr:uncharacterized protein JN550_003698 [Neoarthrinium moseri]KAI1872824.1 hypothetical protein JN550_003698 [Neoarthrinium moseri]
MMAPARGEARDAYRCQTQICLSRIWQSLTAEEDPAQPTYPPISSIPRTSPERLAQASPDNDADGSASTKLYLAYGSNLSAQTFIGVRGIRPISSINVSAPAFDLTFDLAGLPYREPCFANTAPRKNVPKLPLPGDPPTKPPIDLPPSYSDYDGKPRTAGEKEAGPEDPAVSFPALPIRRPTWSKGLYGVVYEVTAADYAKIVQTEGGGASYLDVQTLCVALPPAVHVPEQPPIPELRPFLAHTLYAPRLPVEDEPPADQWWRRLATPVRRPEADYAQPSPRYLGLLREGAAQHHLPFEYQAYLERLEAYTITTRRQLLGRWVFMLLWALPLLLILGLGKVFADGDGKVPWWLALYSGAVFNLMWISYDGVFKKHFGDGERTMEDDDDDGDARDTRGRSWWQTGSASLGEKNMLLGDW